MKLSEILRLYPLPLRYYRHGKFKGKVVNVSVVMGIPNTMGNVDWDGSKHPLAVPGFKLEFQDQGWQFWKDDWVDENDMFIPEFVKDLENL